MYTFLPNTRADGLRRVPVGQNSMPPPRETLSGSQTDTLTGFRGGCFDDHVREGLHSCNSRVRADDLSGQAQPHASHVRGESSGPLHSDQPHWGCGRSRMFVKSPPKRRNDQGFTRAPNQDPNEEKRRDLKHNKKQKTGRRSDTFPVSGLRLMVGGKATPLRCVRSSLAPTHRPDFFRGFVTSSPHVLPHTQRRGRAGGGRVREGRGAGSAASEVSHGPTLHGPSPKPTASPSFRFEWQGPRRLRHPGNSP